MCQLNFLSIYNWKWIMIAFVGIAAGRYFLLAGIAYLFCYKPGLKSLKRFKIQLTMPKGKQLRHELLFSLSTIFIFSSIGAVAYFLFINGRTTVYMDVDKHGWPYFF